MGEVVPKCAVGSFNISTATAGNTVSVSGLPFQPKAVLFWWNQRTESTDAADATTHGQMGFGYMVSATDRGCAVAQAEDDSAAADCDSVTRNDSCIAALTIAGALEGAADFSSFESDGFTVVIDNNFAVDRRICYCALGGSDMSIIQGGTITEPGGTGDQDTTVTGFDSTGSDQCVIFFTGNSTTVNTIKADSHLMVGFAAGSSIVQGVLSNGMNNGSDPTAGARYCSSSRCIAMLDTAAGALDGRASLSSWLTNGFRLNWAERASTRIIGYLALKGGNYLVGNLLTQTDTTTDIVESSFGFQPSGAILMGTGAAEHADDAAAPSTNRHFFGGFSSTSARVAIAYSDVGSVATTDTPQAIEHDECYVDYRETSGIVALMDIKSIDSGGFTCIMDDADPAQKFIVYLAFGEVIASYKLGFAKNANRMIPGPLMV